MVLDAAVWSSTNGVIPYPDLPFEPEIGERKGWYYTVIQVETIFMKLGLPYNQGEGLS